MNDPEIKMLHGIYPYKLPHKPLHKNILFHNRSKENQFWDRSAFPFPDEVNSWSADRQKKFRKQERKRQEEGIWFYNNGETTYLTGHNYFFLMRFPIRGVEENRGYPKFRKSQNETFQFIDFCEKDPFCEGEIISKVRRYGLTSMYVAIDLNLLLLKREITISVQSKTQDNARESNFEPLKYAFDKMEDCLKLPRKKWDTKKVEFGYVAPRITGTKENERAWEHYNKKEKIDNKYYYTPTKVNQDDSGKFFRLRRDEISKYPSGQSPKLSWEISAPCCKVGVGGNTQYGKSAYFSTSSEKDTKIFFEWKELYKNSDYSKRERNRTTTHLYNWFISALESLDGAKDDELGIDLTGLQFFDIYGNCNEKLAYDTIMNVIRAPKEKSKDWAGLQAVIRQYPINVEEAFGTSGADSYYDFPHLSEALLNIEEKTQNGEVLYRLGDLDWDNSQSVGNGYYKVNFNTSTTGDKPFKLFHSFERGNGNNLTNRVFVDRAGYLSPFADTPIIIALDPYSSLDQVASGQGSRAAIVAGSVFDIGLPNGGNTIHMTHLDRPATNDILLGRLKKLLIYTGGLLYIEKNRGAHLIQQLIKDGFGRFLLVYDKGEFRRWKYGEIIAGGYTSNDLIKNYMFATESYIKRPEMINGKSEVDYCLTILDEEVIKQWIDFDPEDTLKFDMAVAASLWTMVVKNYRRTVDSRPTDDGETEFVLAFFGRKKHESRFGTTGKIK